MKVYINGQAHMTKMAAMAINSQKNVKNLLLQNQKSYNCETWFEALGNGALQNAYKSCTWNDLDLFYGKVNIGHLCIYLEKIVKMGYEGQNLQETCRKWANELEI